jgi:hypothetical protein
MAFSGPFLNADFQALSHAFVRSERFMNCLDDCHRVLILICFWMPILWIIAEIVAYVFGYVTLEQVNQWLFMDSTLDCGPDHRAELSRTAQYYPCKCMVTWLIVNGGWTQLQRRVVLSAIFLHGYTGQQWAWPWLNRSETLTFRVCTLAY